MNVRIQLTMQIWILISSNGSTFESVGESYMVLWVEGGKGLEIVRIVRSKNRWWKSNSRAGR